MSRSEFSASWVLRALAEEARIRGDIGKTHGPNAEDWIEGWAAKLDGNVNRNADLAWEAIERLMTRTMKAKA